MWTRIAVGLSFGTGLFIVALLLVLPAAGQVSGGSPLQPALETVDSLRQAGDFEGARARLVELREEHPGRVDILWRLVYTYADLGKATEDASQRTAFYEEALDVAKATVAADSADAHAHLAMAVAQGRAALNAGTQERIRRSRAVKRHADRAISLDSTLGPAYHVRGRWHREVADLGFFKRALVRTVYGGLPDASFDQAVRDFQRALELEDEIHHHLELGKTYMKMDRPEAARGQLQRVLEMSSPHPFAATYKEQARELLEEMG